MTESQPEPQAQPAKAPGPSPEKKPFQPVIEDGNFRKFLENHLGKMFLIANPESFEESGLGHQIKAGWYKARLIGLGDDYLIVLTEFQHGSGKKATKEPMRQYIPIRRIKRVSIMRTERLIHI